MSLFDAKCVVFDIETDSESHKKDDNLDFLKCRPVCIAFAWSEDGQTHSTVLEWSQLTAEHKAMMANPDIKKIGANIKFDAKIFQHNTGVEVKNLYYDTIIAAKLIDENQDCDMASLCKKWLKKEPQTPYPEWNRKAFKRFGEKYEHARHTRLLEHCQEDVELTLELVKVLTPELKKINLFNWLVDTEMKVVEIFVRSELLGMPVRKDKLEVLLKDYEQRLSQIEEELRAITGNVEFNPNSGKQIAQYLYATRTPRAYTESSKDSQRPIGSTDKSEIKYWAEKGVPLAIKLQEYKRWEGLRKHVQSIIDAIVEDKIHSTFNTYGTVTGRFASRQPNLQNIPARDEEAAKIRKCFEGLYLVFDYSQIEPRLLGHFANEPLLIQSYAEGKGVYEPIMEKTGMSRSDAKIFYLASTYKLDDNFYSLLPAVKEFKEQILGVWQYEHVETRDGRVYDKRIGKAKLGEVYNRRYTTSLFHRRRNVPDIYKNLQPTTYWKCAADEREAFNFIMQGSCADIIKLAMVRLATMQEYRDGRFYIANTVHDEVVIYILDDTLYQSQEFLERVKRIMKMDELKLRIPLEVDGGFGNSWESAKG